MSHLDLDRLRAYSASLPAGSLARVRQDAIELLAATGLPTTRDEDFKYTDLSEVGSLSDSWLGSPAESAPSPDADALIDSLRTIESIDWLVIRNGAIDALTSAALDGIRVSPLSTGSRPPSAATPMSALNLALLDDGVRIEITASRERALGLLLVDDAETAAGVSPARIDIRLGEQCTAEIVEYHASFGDEGHYSNVFLHLDIADAARLRHTRIQDRGLAHSQTNNLEVVLGRDAGFRSASFDFGGKLTRNDLRVDLPARGADAEFNGLYLAGEGQHVDNHTLVDHRVGPAKSAQEYRGILAGASRAVWNGKALVYEGADGTDAEQANHNLLLTEKAEIDTKPELEIYAEDVRCSHGTTVGQLDERALFYLRSRGLAEDDARRLLVHAFAAQTLDSIPVTAIREHVAMLLDQRLRRMEASL